MTHEWGHNMGLGDHFQASQQVAGTLMNHAIEDPPYYQGPTPGDLSSVRCLENWICHSPGVWRAGSWLIRYSNSRGSDGNALAEGVFEYQLATDKPLAGDWDRDGDETAGVYRPSEGKFYLSNDNHSNSIAAPYGNAGDIPLSGDWDSDGDDNIGVYRPSNATFYLSANNSTTWVTAQFGNVGDTPIVGDWDASGSDTIGVWRGATWYLKNVSYPGQADISFLYGNSTDTPVKGDWR